MTGRLSFSTELTELVSQKSLQNELWELYREAFSGSKEACAQNQCCYTRGLLRKALKDGDYWKFILRTDSELAGFILITNNLEKARIAYINPERFEKMFPDFAAKSKIYYVTFFGIAPKFQQTEAFSILCSALLEFIFSKIGGMVAFDFSYETKAKYLPAMSKKVAEKLLADHSIPLPINYKVVGTQEFGALLPETNPSPGH